MVKLLILSNGHGEDAIAARIVEQLLALGQSQKEVWEFAILPLVGEGHAYAHLNLPILGPTQTMPSGGFIYMDSHQFWRDLQDGLVQLTLKQYGLIRDWGKTGGKILAVGDLVPLLFAWLSGGEYGFVGTAKSEYHLRDETGWLATTPWLLRQLGSIYFPWERWLMSRPRCRAVFPRDSLTSETLQLFSIPALPLGNPMMDGLRNPEMSPTLTEANGIQTVLLLPGSRAPEAFQNWQLILLAVQQLLRVESQQKWRFLAAIAPHLSLSSFQTSLMQQGWQALHLPASEFPVEDPHALGFQEGQSQLFLSQKAYADCLQKSQVAIAMAGTATEQFVGLGKPVFSLPGKGPQFNPHFARQQTYLLGPSVILLETPQQIAEMLPKLLSNSTQLKRIQENGYHRLGKPGAAARIAHHLAKIWTFN
jgi:uncharacterized protein (TIGR03492 family)